MTMDILDELNALVTTLRDAGVDAYLDPRDLNPPCAWVVARNFTVCQTIGGSGEMQVEVYLIVPDLGYEQDCLQLNALLDRALEVIQPDEPVSLSEQVGIPGVTSPLPAYQITVNIPTG
ncbi:hypothetical protein AAFP35_08275 [Gordonia sp. CPCC 206044]|uniref:hypothetical protein n=1 Tax=Gordonia sp. CPCC 206044 TaxID=3140793 RepID=UPI003AF3DC6E